VRTKKSGSPDGDTTDRNDPKGHLKLLDTNVGAYKDLVPKVAEAAPGAVLLVVSDPPDPLADLARRLAGHDRVLFLLWFFFRSTRDTNSYDW
jgi:malate/lactate dehydrogenase